MADQLGVSPSTVSLALHNRPGVSESTRSRIFEALRKQGLEELIPAELPRKLRNIRLVLYKNGKDIITDTPFFLQLIEGIDQQAKKNGFNLMISYLTSGPGIQKQIHQLLENNCEGIILLATEMAPEQVAPFRLLGLPLVALDANFEDIEVNCVAISNTLSTKRSVEHLIQLGHKKIGYFKGVPSIRNFEERYEGYRQAMEASGLSIQPDSVIQSAPSAEAAYVAMKDQLLRFGISSTAIVCDNDNILFGVMKALREYNVAVPDRISLIGFDDIPLTELYDPPLTTIRVPKRQMGGIAVSLMNSLLEQPAEAPVKISVGTKLILRKSTAPPTVS